MSLVSRRRAIAMAGGLTAMAVGCARQAKGDDDGPMRFDYGPHPSQYAELSRPPNATSAPVVVVIHGGYWRSSYGAELGRPLATDLLGRGFAVLNVEYRRVGDGGGWPQTGEDVAAAVDALAERSTGLDLGRVVGLGHSAGGQLAGWLAARRDGAVVLSGAVLQAGVLDLVRGAADGLGGGAVDDFLGGPPARQPQAYAEASPVALVPLRVPTVCVHGTADTVVPLNQSERFVAAASAAGDSATLHTFDGDHFDPITVGTRAWDLCVDGIRTLTGS